MHRGLITHSPPVCASRQFWEPVLGIWARPRGLSPVLELRYWNSWRVLAWVRCPHPRQPLLPAPKEATPPLADCQAWEHLYLHPPPLVGTWRLQNPAPPRCPHSSAVSVQVEVRVCRDVCVYNSFKLLSCACVLLCVCRWVWPSARAFSCAEPSGSEAHWPLLASGTSAQSSITTTSAPHFSVACPPAHQHASTGRPGDGCCCY